MVYNGASTRLAGTIAYLEQTFGVTATTKTDAAIRADVVVTIGQSTPDLQAPVAPWSDAADGCRPGPARRSQRRRPPDARAWRYSIGVTQWLYSGSRPRTASK